jgi:hypothetical protein
MGFAALNPYNRLLAGTTIGAQLRRPDIRQSSRSAFRCKAVTRK